MKPTLLRISLVASFLAFSAPLYAGPGKTPSELASGNPALEHRLPPENYVEFETRRLKNAWVAWCDLAWFRDHGVDVPANGIENEAFVHALLDAFAYQVPHTDDSPEAFTERTKKYYAHDETNEYHVDDIVWIEERRPLSKLKRWEVVRGEKKKVV